MRYFNWLTRKWNEHQERQRIRAHHTTQAQAINNAIAQSDSDKIVEIAAQIEQFDVFVPRHIKSFLCHAVNRDDLETFKAVIGLSSDVNVDYVLHDSWEMFEVGHGYSKTPLIIEALEKQAFNVAKYLAQHPDTDINARAYSEDTDYDDDYDPRTVEKFGAKPSELAEEIGAVDIAKILLIREANELRAKALKISQPSSLS